MKILLKGIFTCSLLGGLVYSSTNMMANPDKIVSPATEQSNVKHPALFNDCSGVKPWSASTVYNGNEMVTHNGRLYWAQWWNLMEEPGTNPWGAWDDWGPCTYPIPPNKVFNEQ